MAVSATHDLPALLLAVSATHDLPAFLLAVSATHDLPASNRRLLHRYKDRKDYLEAEKLANKMKEGEEPSSPTLPDVPLDFDMFEDKKPDTKPVGKTFTFRLYNDNIM